MFRVTSLLPNYVRQLPIAAKHVLHKLRTIGKLHSTQIKRVFFILSAVVCSIVIVRFDINHKLLPGNTKPKAEVVKQGTPEPVVDPAIYPKQQNPLFSSTPAWAQDFTAKRSVVVDPQYWNVLVGPAQNSNKEQQYYTADATNLRIENNALRIVATKGQYPEGYNYGSARIETQGKKAFLYGRIDITAKLPSGVGTWPAIWMLPDNNKYENMSPESNTLRYKNGGEIDIIEAVGFNPDMNFGVAHTASDLVLRADGTGSNGVFRIPNSTSAFNKYTLLWTPNKLVFMINEQVYYEYARQAGADYTTWPFDQPFYLIANLAMGGSWGGMDTAHFPGNGIDNSALPSSLDIQSIYYYPFIGPKN